MDAQGHDTLVPYCRASDKRCAPTAIQIAVDRSPRISDTRVHACLYFIAPTGHGYVLRWQAALHGVRLAREEDERGHW